METKTADKTASCRRGRPRAFDADVALEQAMRVFWKHGYEGSSLPELTKAMGINRPSLYAAFGNKETLFRKAVDRYVAKAGGCFQDALALPTARAVAEQLLRGPLTQPSDERGCLLVQGALACGESADLVREDLAKRRCMTEYAIRARFERAIVDGDLPQTADAAALAKLLATLQHGISVQLASGAERKDLLAAVDVALAVWPK